MTISASVVVLLFSTGMLVLLLPYMTAAAEFGYTTLKTVYGPVAVSGRMNRGRRFF